MSAWLTDARMPDDKADDPVFIYGLRAHPPDERHIAYSDLYFKLARDLGMGYVKLGIMWDYIEPQDDQWTWQGPATAADASVEGSTFDTSVGTEVV